MRNLQHPTERLDLPVGLHDFGRGSTLEIFSMKRTTRVAACPKPDIRGDVVERGRLLGRYRKVLLLGTENDVFEPGRSFPVFTGRPEIRDQHLP